MIKEFIIKAILRVKDNNELDNLLYSYGINLIEYNEKRGLSSMVEESLALLLCNESDKQFEDMLDTIQWWIYERVDKIITVNDEKIDVTKAENFVDFLFKHYVDNIT